MLRTKNMHQLLIGTLVVISLGGALARINVTGLNYKQLYADPHKFFRGIHVGGRVIGGKEATAHSRPYEAYAILFGKGGVWLCGGALISQNYILTAGHCVSGAVIGEVILGAHNIQEIESTQVVYAIESMVLHEGYDEQEITYDIGLIKLLKPVTLTSSIQTIALPSKSDVDNTYEGDSVTISGWGLTDGQGGAASNVLMEVDVNVISNSECAKAFSNVKNYQICTSGADGTGACNGDSGSPLIRNNVAIGLISYGVNYCVAGYPTVSTNVGSFLDWIVKNSDVSVA